ncbi:hypothetical protein D0Z07_5009 [Hyphodiscus hymeniophilus]|uniref:DUF1479-domain-containing protein n=1 Tax=Hyphodiscus hymeniophilus TaxID=353542 RepID=A0A9P6VJW1_9HELO|nr:hypothetical protein D0Z07_5009 [Hyphodiscus hymeniophilus]
MPHSIAPTSSSLDYWPPWPLFNAQKAENRPENVNIKQEIIQRYGEEGIRRSWLQTCATLEQVTAEIEAKKTAMIPALTLDELLNASEEKKQALRSLGCFVVRGVVPRNEATQWYWDLKGYVNENRDHITGFPEPSPYMFNVYHSPAQQAGRSHPNSLAVQRALLQLWHDDDDLSKSFAEPLSYADAFRIRAPKSDGVFTLPPHIDGGSLSRWADKTYSSTYSAIFSGNPEKHDPYDLTVRKNARSALFPGTASSVLRAFQGWTALTECGPKEGSLLLYPNLHVASAYMLLRPFFDPPENDEELLDAEKWTFNAQSEWFPGTFTAKPQMLSPNCHPHLKLEKCMIDIPRMFPGDTVWWHADMIHAVEQKHEGEYDSSVMYIAATPSTSGNISYIKEQLRSFENGLPPSDFMQGTNETVFKGYLGEAGIMNGEAGRRAAGFGL